jgi:hypothetical protein
MKTIMMIHSFLRIKRRTKTQIIDNLFLQPFKSLKDDEFWQFFPLGSKK